MKKTLKLAVGFKGHAPGSLVSVEVDSNGIPLDEFWRARLEDAKIDGCCEFVKASQTKTTSLETK